MNCTKCGGLVSVADRFCGTCGAAIAGNSATAPEMHSHSANWTFTGGERGTISNRQLMESTRARLKDHWGDVVPAWLIYMGITLGVGMIPVLGTIANVVITGPLRLGMATFSIRWNRGLKVDTSEIFGGFDDFGRSFVAYLLMIIYIILWTILLIVPGIIASLSYSQTFFILSENPTMTAGDAIKASRDMMLGHRWKFFCLGWRFFGWIILSICTLGIGFIWLAPYMGLTFTKFYEDVSGKRTSA